MLTFTLMVADFCLLVILIHNTMGQWKKYLSLPQYTTIHFHMRRFKFTVFKKEEKMKRWTKCGNHHNTTNPHILHLDIIENEYSFQWGLIQYYCTVWYTYLACMYTSVTYVYTCNSWGTGPGAMLLAEVRDMLVTNATQAHRIISYMSNI